MQKLKCVSCGKSFDDYDDIGAAARYESDGNFCLPCCRKAARRSIHLDDLVPVVKKDKPVNIRPIMLD